jgi:DNA-binding SARP family transcriptional activator/tetratricopeptide (TPR) repeat protein
MLPRRPGSTRAGGLAIHVLGPLEVSVDGVPIVVDTRKALAILALLAVEQRPFAREELAALLWPDSDDESARAALRRTLSVLRAALGGRWVRVDRSAVRLDLSTARVDLHAIEQALASDDQPVLQTASDAARGPLLAGFTLRDSAEFDDWRATRAVAVERSVAAVLDRLSAVAEANGDAAAACSAAARRVDLDPLDEGAHRRLMALFARSGDRGAAIRQYRACVAVLERELGVAPLAETTELYEAIRDGRHVDDGVDGAAIVAGSPIALTPPAVAPPQASGATAARLPMVGRRADLDAVKEAWASSAVDGRVVIVTGEAGIGKSRLIEAAVAAIGEDGSRALVARSYASESGIAYGPIVELLRSGLSRPDAVERLAGLPSRSRDELERLIALPTSLAGRPGSAPVSSATGDPAARTRLLEAIAGALEALVAGPGPGLVAVEDLQWADDATRAMLAWLARRLAGRRLLLVLTWRPEDLEERGAAFASMLEGIPGVAPVRLDRLDLAAIQDLVDAAAAAGLPALEAGVLLAQSEGLPLFVVEALAGADARSDRAAGVADQTGRTVRALIHERIASVSETASQVLAAGAVIGRSFDAGLVRGASGRSEDETVGALEELVRRGLVREVGSGSVVSFDFAHARFRDAVYEGTSLARRRLLHGRAAELLRADTASRDDLGRLVQVARHERAAGHEAEAADAFRVAGLRAREIYALHEATSHLETALALGHPDVSGIQVALGDCRTAQGDYAGAIAAFEAAAARSDEVSLPAIELRLGRVHARRGDPTTAASHFDAAIEALDPIGTGRGGDEATLVHALVERALVAVGVGDADLAGASAVRALALAEAEGDAAAAGAAHRTLGLISRERGDLESARAALRRSLELAGGDPDAGAAIAAGNALALVEAAAGDREAAIVLLEVALNTARRTGELHLEAAVENNLADQLHAAGRQDEAMVHLKRAVSLFADVGGRPGELEPEIWKLVAW